jgi:hypothetical protein
VAEYGLPTVAAGNEVVVNARGAIVTASERVAVAVLLAESVTVIPRDAAAVAVGVPEKMPAEDSVIPAGRVPVVTANVYGAVPPLAASVAE